MRLVDTHSHLDFEELASDLEQVLLRAAQKGVVHIITVGISMETSEKAISLSSNLDQVSATVGIHPHGAHAITEGERRLLLEWLSLPEVVALGEIGLDYYRNYQPRDLQRKCFAAQLDIAVQAQKPVVFHIREAFDDFFEIVSPLTTKISGGIVHCFSGDWEIAKRCFDLGFFISIPGVVTYPKATTLQDVVKRSPLDRLLIETDAPFLAPHPYRGKTNEPAFVFYTAQKIAEIRGEGLEKIAEITTQNAVRAFGIPL